MARQTPIALLYRIDAFGTEARFNLAGQERIGSCLGVFLTLFIVAVTTVYALQRAKIMLEMGDTALYSHEEMRNGDSFDFYSQNATNFNFAFNVARTDTWSPHVVDIEGYLEWSII